MTTERGAVVDEPWRQRSLWMHSLEGTLVPRPSLDGDLWCDVVIVGAGMTGLWTAYYLSQLRPNLRIVVVEKEIAGFGPSGRNGGWVSSGIAGTARAFGIDPASATALRAERETYATVDEIGSVVAREEIDCAFLKSGMLTVATTAPQVQRLQGLVAGARAMGLTDLDVRELTVDQVREHVTVPGTQMGVFNPHGARIDPARLTRGLAEACERLGVQILEQTAATSIGPRRVVCRTGVIRAEHVIRATEAYTVELRKQSRRYLPLYSLMVATEPLSQEVWAEIGWRDGLLVRDTRHLFFYAQRTSDGRIAMGGRGAPYAFGSPIAAGSERNDEVRKRLVRALVKHFPAARDAKITHHWGGPLAVPRDWSMSVDYDKTSGLGTAGGYSGHGVVASNISGRTMAHLVTGVPSEITTLPWVGHHSRSWEPEPLRFLASRAIVRVLERADRVEDTTQRRARSQMLVRPFMPGH